MKKVLSSKGFTMIELMVVLVIIGILAMILVPQLLDNTAKAKCGEIPSVLAGFDHAQLVYFHENNVCSAKASDLAFKAPGNDGATPSKWFSFGTATDYRLVAVNSTAAKIGDIAAGADIASTVVTSTDGAATHTVASAYKKYLSSFTAGTP
jgi:prepilin-type N-terminal cleavage/methylation domain-containing protein